MKIEWMPVRLKARAQRKTWNALFREWLARFAADAGDTQSFDKLMKRMKRVDAGRPFCRDEMNQRSSSSQVTR
jgi:hypothetical protein